MLYFLLWEYLRKAKQLDYEFEHENILQPSDGSQFDIYDRDPRDILHIRCPHCQIFGSFACAMQRLGYAKDIEGTSKSRSWTVMASVRVCPSPSCRGVVFTVSAGDQKFMVLPSETISFQTDDVPEALVKTLKEAIVCHANGAYRASSMMVRRLLEELCDDCDAIGKNLHERLETLRTQIILPQELFDAMDELKSLGNDAAHIEAKAYKNIDREEAQLSIELAQEILKARYQHKSLITRLRSRRSPS